jgi:hypothetical protein
LRVAVVPAATLPKEIEVDDKLATCAIAASAQNAQTRGSSKNTIVRTQFFMAQISFHMSTADPPEVLL